MCLDQLCLGVCCIAQRTGWDTVGYRHVSRYRLCDARNGSRLADRSCIECLCHVTKVQRYVRIFPGSDEWKNVLIVTRSGIK